MFNPIDGSLIDDVTVPSGATSNPVIADNILYFVSRMATCTLFANIFYAKCDA